MSTVYKPDKWVVVSVQCETEILYKVFGSWSGSYTSSDWWKLNSGITRVESSNVTWSDGSEHEILEFFGYSGSSYLCNPEMYGVAGMYNHGILQGLIDRSDGKVTIMPEDTDWKNFKYVQ